MHGGTNHGQCVTSPLKDTWQDGDKQEMRRRVNLEVIQMQVLMIDADSKKGFPNLALMKLSAFLKEVHGDLDLNIDLIKGIPSTAPLYAYDKTYVSVIFFQNKERVQKYINQFPEGHLEVGGSGWDLQNKLPEPIEHIMPDYSLYDIDFSMGYTSRGCIRNCGFCVVPEKEGHIHDHAPLDEFVNANHDKVMLLDNNFQASPKWRNNLQYLIDYDYKVNFNQGLDIRLLTKDFVEYLAQVNYQNWKFTRKSINFAFDDLSYERQLRNGFRLLEHYGINLKVLSIYMLTGYNTTREEDRKRLDILKEYKVLPYVMRYNRTGDQWQKHFARYVNRRYFQFIEWDKYKNGVLNK